jgi:dTDP-4-dehydrorhamnose 3,5-epimerase
VLYQMGDPYVPEAASGVRWDDPMFGIDWPECRGERIVSERDSSYPYLGS